MLKARILAGLGLAVLASAAHGALVVSKAPSSNVTCLSGTCQATAADAVLNVGDAKHMLSAGDLTIKSGSVAMDIDVATTLTWARSHKLALDSYRAIFVSAPVTSEGLGGVVLVTNDGGSGGDYDFTDKGKIAFLDTGSSLTINGRAFTLVNDVASLASGIAASPSGAFALARGYDASMDGTYVDAAVPTDFSGTFEGLGHAAANLTIQGRKRGTSGFFQTLAAGSTVRDFRLVNAHVEGWEEAGVLAAFNAGTIQAVSVDGSVAGSVAGRHGRGSAGGLVGFNQGTITHSTAAVNVSVNAPSDVGGLVGLNAGPIQFSSAGGTVSSPFSAEIGGLVGANADQGSIADSFATGAVSGGDGARTGDDYAGGLVGFAQGSILRSYARGAVTGGSGAEGRHTTYVVDVGGLVGYAFGVTIDQAYATGAVSAGPDWSVTGGAMGFGANDATYGAVYWDETASGSGTACGTGTCTGVTGLTTTQFTSGLPGGFDAGAWSQDAGINGGYPYLTANTPR